MRPYLPFAIFFCIALCFGCRQTEFADLDLERLNQIDSKQRPSDILESFDGSTSLSEIDSRVTSILSEVNLDDSTKELFKRQLQGYLSHRSAIYNNRDQDSSLRVRAFMSYAYSKFASPDELWPIAIELLSTAKLPIEVATAAHLVAKFGPEGESAAPLLRRLVGNSRHDSAVCISRLVDSHPENPRTTAYKEAKNALHSVTRQNHHNDQAYCTCNQGLRPVVLETLPEHRSTTTFLDLQIETIRGERTSLGELYGRPTFLTFFYSRCQSANKCALTMASVGRLQKLGRNIEQENAFQILLLTFEPKEDSLHQMARFAADRGVDVDDGNVVIGRVSNVEQFSDFLDSLKVPVNYNGDWVSIHGVSGFVFDRDMRLAFSHYGPPWEPSQVLAYLNTLH